MECLIQYLDDIEDAIFAVALLGERLRRLAMAALRLLSAVLVCGLGVLLVVYRPPLALAVVAVVAVTLLYHSVVSPTPAPSRS